MSGLAGARRFVCRHGGCPPALLAFLLAVGASGVLPVAGELQQHEDEVALIQVKAATMRKGSDEFELETLRIDTGGPAGVEAACGTSRPGEIGSCSAAGSKLDFAYPPSSAASVASSVYQAAASPITLVEEAVPVQMEQRHAPPAPAQEGSGQFADSSLMHSVAGTCLELVACAVVVDGLRRWRRRQSGDLKAPGSSKGAKATAAGDDDVLRKAAAAGDISRFEAAPLKPSTLKKVDSWGCTLLHYAASGGSAPVVELLAEQGAKVDALDAWDETPLHLAARAGHGEVLATLLAAGAAINAVNAEGFTPLAVAGAAGHEALCHLLLGRGANAGDLSEAELPPLLARLLPEALFSGSRDES